MAHQAEPVTFTTRGAVVGFTSYLLIAIILVFVLW